MYTAGYGGSFNNPRQGEVALELEGQPTQTVSSKFSDGKVRWRPTEEDT